MADQKQSSTVRGAARRRTRREFLQEAGTTAVGLALGAAASTLPAGAQSASTTGPTIIVQARKQIVVSTWGGVTEEGLKKVVTPVFEKKYNATVTYDIGGAAARYAKVRAQASSPQIHIILNTEDILLDGVQRGLLTKFDPRNVPNVKDMHEWATPKTLEGYGAAYSIIAYGLVVARDRVRTPVRGWKDLWRDEFKGKLAFLAPAASLTPHMLIIAAELHGGSQSNIEPGMNALAELRPIRQAFFWTDYAAMIKSGDVILATDFDYYALFMQKEGYNVSWVLPEEKAIGTLQYAALVKGAPNQEFAEGYLNTMLDPEIQAGLAKEIFNPPSNKLVKLSPPLSDQVMYGPRLQQVRWFDARFINANRPIWVERINTEVAPKWRV